jgi:DNA replication protein DnaC
MGGTADSTSELCVNGCGRLCFRCGGPAFLAVLRHCAECLVDLAREEEQRRQHRCEGEALKCRLKSLDRDLGCRLARYTLGGYPTSHRGRAEAVRAAEAWLESYYAGARRNLILHGPAGEAKTGLAVGLARALVERVDVKFIVWRDWLDVTRRAFAAGTDAPSFAPHSCAVLVLDDLGSERGTPFALEQLLSLIDHRYRQELPTIITSNFAPSGLAAELGKLDETIGARIVSRLVEDAVSIGFSFGDLRLPIPEFAA